MCFAARSTRVALYTVQLSWEMRNVHAKVHRQRLVALGCKFSLEGKIAIVAVLGA